MVVSLSTVDGENLETRESSARIDITRSQVPEEPNAMTFYGILSRFVSQNPYTNSGFKLSQTGILR